MVPKIHFPCWTRSRVFKGLGATDMLHECWQGEHFLAVRAWNMAIYRNGVFTPIFLVNGPFTSKRVLVFGLNWHFGFMLGAGAQDFGSRCSWRAKFSPLCVPRLRDLWAWSVVSEKQFSTYFVKQDRIILSWFCDYKPSPASMIDLRHCQIRMCFL